MKKEIKLFFILLFGVFFSLSFKDLAPRDIKGEVYYVPFPIQIKINGDLSDWEKIPLVKVEKGTKISHAKGENDAFFYSLAADEKYLYIKMLMNDKIIIAGKHGKSFWNEDSLEFFINASGNLIARSYTRRIFQVNITPIDIGNTNPDKITITGTHSNLAKLHGYIFKTDTGWGCELALDMTGLLIPNHGVEFGFQAQANGAREKDRNIKLIWSNLDTADSSWRDPSVFGRAIFFKIGRTDIPLPTKVVFEKKEEIIPAIALNQTGYLPDSPKKITLESSSIGTLDFVLIDKKNNIVYEGETQPFGLDVNSGNEVHIIDISAWKMEGDNYHIEAGGNSSYEFNINKNIYSQLRKDALSFFYQSRSGIPILEEYVGRKDLARPAGHLSDNEIKCFKGNTESGGKVDGYDYTLDLSKGWYDAGDWGKYVVNGGITVWTLLNQYELNPTFYKDNQLKIPENNNSIPDLLDEVRWEIEFLLKMQVPKGYSLSGMVHHKMHNRQYEPERFKQPTTMDNNKISRSGFDEGRYVYPPTTAATLNFAAVTAQAARIWKNIDPEFAKQCLKQAEIAWKAVEGKIDIPAGNIPGVYGDYGDMNLVDEYYWAACELFITTGKREYKKYMKSNKYFLQVPQTQDSSMSWAGTATLGTISLAFIPNKLNSKNILLARAALINIADQYLKIIEKEGYKVPINDYRWGSNSFVLNNMIIMGYAYKFTGDKKYIYGMLDSMDYIMGRNPLGKSYISGYGKNPLKNPHHRFWANSPEEGYPLVPPGVIAGGPNRLPEQTDYSAQEANLRGKAQAKCYVDAIGSYSTNEIAINWNAALAWVSAFMDDYANGNIEIFNKVVSASSSNMLIVFIIITLLFVILLTAGLILFLKIKKKKAETNKISNTVKNGE